MVSDDRRPVPPRRRRGPAWEPFATRLSREVVDILDAVDRLLGLSTINNVDPNRRSSGVWFVGAATWGWAPSDDAQTALRLELLERFRRWRELFELLYRDPPPDVLKPISEGIDLIESWLTRPYGDHSVPSSIPEARSLLTKRAAGLLDAIQARVAIGSGIIAIPDTNALLAEPDVAAYGKPLGVGDYEVRLLPTVTGELDRLKFEGRTEELREKVKAVVRRIKGYRDRGSLSTGVSVTKRVRLRSLAREPDFSRLPGWLDRTQNDDRIIAAALELQGEAPGGTVVLITADLNLQTKADAAGLPYVEPPEA